MNDADKTRDSWEQLSKKYAGRPTMFAVHGIAKMIGQVVKAAFPLLALVGLLLIMSHQTSRMDQRSHNAMEADIQDIAKALEHAELPKETAEIVEDALHRVKWWVQLYTPDNSHNLYVPLIVFAIFMFAGGKKEQANGPRIKSGLWSAKQM